MSITNLTYTVKGTHPNRAVLYEGTDHLGGTHRKVVRTADATYDPSTQTTTMTAALEARLRIAEVEGWLADTDAPFVVVHATKQDYANALRAAYKDAEKEELYRLSYKLYSRYDAGDLTAQELRTAFGMTPSEFSVFATKVQGYHDAWVTMRAAVGE